MVTVFGCLSLFIIASVDCGEPSTNGTKFMFGMPDYLGKKRFVALNVVTFDTSNKMNVSQIVDSVAAVHRCHNLEQAQMFVPLEEEYFLPKDSKPTIYIETLWPVHIFLWLQRDLSTTALVKLLPVNVWGRVYYVVTLTAMPTILITSQEGHNDVSVTVKVGRPKAVSITYNHLVFKDDRKVSFTLKSLESFFISQCNEEDLNYEKGPMTGTKISAKKIVGVITGNCLTFSQMYVCDTNKTLYSKTMDMSLDSPYPVEYYGTEFITFLTRYFVADDSTSSPNGEITIVASQPNTEVTIGSDHTYRNMMEDPGDYVIVLNDMPQTIKTSKPATATFTMWYRCDGPQKDKGMPSMTFLIPTELYYNYYTMRQLDVSSESLQFILIFNLNNSKFLNEFNIETLPNRIQDILGKPPWAFGFLPVQSELATVHMTSGNRFGCYILYLSDTYGSITYADFLLKPINVPTTTMTTTTSTKPPKCVHDSSVVADDLKDNDCDGKIDEEIFDNIDNDQDGFVDEDYYIKNGFFLNWQEWQCTQNCSEPALFRYRTCFHPDLKRKPICEGASFESKPSLCFYKKSCPADCPPFFWGIGCVLDCSQCEKPCNKFNGSCDRCRPGYQNPELGCRRICDINKFGQDCSEDCLQKCGDDCLERVTGTCPRWKYTLLIILTVVLLLPCCNLIRQGKFKEEDYDSDDEAPDISGDDFESVALAARPSNAKGILKNGQKSDTQSFGRASINSVGRASINSVRRDSVKSVGRDSMSSPKGDLKSAPKSDKKTVSQGKLKSEPKGDRGSLVIKDSPTDAKAPPRVSFVDGGRK